MGLFKSYVRCCSGYAFMLTMRDCQLKNKRLLIREDLNVPLENGKIRNEARILACVPTLQEALKEGACVLVLAHLGRPCEGVFEADFSLAPVAKRLSELLNCPVPLINDWNINLKPGEIALFENVRFLEGEKENDSTLAKKYAALCDIFVMDAFACAHRAQASTVGVIDYAPLACAGPLLEKELTALNTAFENPAHPLVAIIGGSKISTKLSVLAGVLKKADILIVGGGMANTFLKAMGYEIGLSLVELDLLPQAKALLDQAKKENKQILLPQDVVVSKTLSHPIAEIKNIEDVKSNEGIYDIGPKTIEQYEKMIHCAKTIIWNGPVGVFELAPFQLGTQKIAQAIAQSDAFSVAGGGDTLSAIDTFGIGNELSYISTGGGAFLEFLEGQDLPSVKALKKRTNQHD